MREVLNRGLSRLKTLVSAQVSLMLVAVVTGLTAARDTPFVQDLTDTSAGDMLLGFLTMRLSPPAGGVLRLYVVLLILALCLYPLLTRGRLGLVLAVSLALYAWAQVDPAATGFTDMSGTIGITWAGWQLPFVLALLVGWTWETRGWGRWLRAHPGAAVLVGLAGLFCARELEATWPATTEHMTFGPGRALAAFSFCLAGYGALTAVSRLSERWLSAPATLGARSLDAYVIQAVVCTTLPAYLAFDRASSANLVLAAITLLGCWAWAEARRHAGAPWPTARFLVTAGRLGPQRHLDRRPSGR